MKTELRILADFEKAYAIDGHPTGAEFTLVEYCATEEKIVRHIEYPFCGFTVHRDGLKELAAEFVKATHKPFLEKVITTKIIEMSKLKI